MASGSGIDDMGTEFEKHIFELISQDCDPGNTYLLFSNNLSIKLIVLLIGSVYCLVTSGEMTFGQLDQLPAKN